MNAPRASVCDILVYWLKTIPSVGLNSTVEQSSSSFSSSCQCYWIIGTSRRAEIFRLYFSLWYCNVKSDAPFGFLFLNQSLEYDK